MSWQDELEQKFYPFITHGKGHELSCFIQSLLTEMAREIVDPKSWIDWEEPYVDVNKIEEIVKKYGANI